MNTNREQIIRTNAFSTGFEANDKLSDYLVEKEAKMFAEDLQREFDTMYEAKLSAALQEVVNIHAAGTKKRVQETMKTVARNHNKRHLDRQKENQITNIKLNLDLSDIDIPKLEDDYQEMLSSEGAIKVTGDSNNFVGF